MAVHLVQTWYQAICPPCWTKIIHLDIPERFNMRLRLCDWYWLFHLVPGERGRSIPRVLCLKGTSLFFPGEGCRPARPSSGIGILLSFPSFRCDQRDCQTCLKVYNLIESVFSGMARAIIHNSNYKDTTECQEAIDRYIRERNEHFLKNPHRAGKYLWGLENVKPVFDEANNCKTRVR